MEVVGQLSGNTPSVFSVDEVAKILRIARVSVYQAIERGELPSIRFGRRILIPRTALERLLNVFPSFNRAEDRSSRASHRVDAPFKS